MTRDVAYPGRHAPESVDPDCLTVGQCSECGLLRYVPPWVPENDRTYYCGDCDSMTEWSA